MQDKISDILKRNHLSITEARKKILGLFWESGNAMAHGDIEQKSSDEFDRVTIYRTLQTFVEKESYIPYPLQIIQYVMHCAKTNAEQVTITTTMFILSVMIAEPPTALMK